MLRSRLVVLPTPWRGVGLPLVEPGGRPGPALVGSGALAGMVVFVLECRNPRPTSPPGCRGSFPWVAQIGGEAPGEAQFGVRGDDQPGPSVGRLRGTDARAGPAEGLFEQPEGVFKVEAVQERLRQEAA